MLYIKTITTTLVCVFAAEVSFIKDCSLHPLLGERHSALLSASKDVRFIKEYIQNLGKGHFTGWNSISMSIYSAGTLQLLSPH